MRAVLIVLFERGELKKSFVGIVLLYCSGNGGGIHVPEGDRLISTGWQRSGEFWIDVCMSWPCDCVPVNMAAEWLENLRRLRFCTGRRSDFLGNTKIYDDEPSQWREKPSFRRYAASQYLSNNSGDECCAPQIDLQIHMSGGLTTTHNFYSYYFFWERTLQKMLRLMSSGVITSLL